MPRATPTPSRVLYCECGPITRPLSGTRWPSPDEVAQWVRRALARLPQPPQWIALSGGDHPRFAVVIDRVLAARSALVPSARVAVLADGEGAVPSSVGDALQRVDAGTLQEWCRQLMLGGPAGVQIHSFGGVPRERLEAMAGLLRDALSGLVVEVF